MKVATRKVYGISDVKSYLIAVECGLDRWSADATIREIEQEAGRTYSRSSVYATWKDAGIKVRDERNGVTKNSQTAMRRTRVRIRAAWSKRK